MMTAGRGSLQHNVDLEQWKRSGHLAGRGTSHKKK